MTVKVAPPLWDGVVVGDSKGRPSVVDGVVVGDSKGRPSVVGRSWWWATVKVAPPLAALDEELGGGDGDFDFSFVVAE